MKNIAPALAKAQLEIGIAERNQVNAEHRNRYADLSSIIVACREALAKQEISILQPLSGSASELLIKTILIHSSGEMIESEVRATPDNPSDMDAVASLVTKWRRYSLQSMLSIASADDDGAAAKPKVVEKHDATKPEIVSSSKQKDWREVVCHIGMEGGPMKGRKLGDMEAPVLRMLADDFLPALGKSAKDRALAAAIEEAVKGPELPLPATTTPPEPENPVATPPEPVATPPKEESRKQEPMEWRSIPCHSFKASPKTTLGELADSPADKFIEGWDGPKIIRWLRDEGIAKIEAKVQTLKDRILVNAIRAANEEMYLRDFLALRFANFGIDFNAHLVKSGVFENGETLATVSRKMLDYLTENWADVEASIVRIRDEAPEADFFGPSGGGGGVLVGDDKGGSNEGPRSTTKESKK